MSGHEYHGPSDASDNGYEIDTCPPDDHVRVSGGAHAKIFFQIFDFYAHVPISRFLFFGELLDSGVL